MSEQKQTFVIFLFASLIIGCLGVGNLAGQERERTWTSADRSAKIKATLSQYDPETGAIQLILSDGTTRSIFREMISTSDRRYLRGYLKRETSREEIIGPESSPATFPLFGIQWVPDLSQALQLASGRTGKADDRPVMCFRVLGDLRGPM
jgi:hypothetical protein